MNILMRYGIVGTIYLLYCKIRTVFTFKNARIVRFPIDLRNRHMIKVGSGFTTGRGCRLEVETSHLKASHRHGYKLIIGKNVQLNDYCHITAGGSVIIGNNVLIASRVYISDISHGSYGSEDVESSPNSVPASRPLVSGYVKIEDNVWLGEGVCILPNTVIGAGSIIGANSVVTKDIPPASIAVGAPAKVIKKYDFELNKWVKI